MIFASNCLLTIGLCPMEGLLVRSLLDHGKFCWYHALTDTVYDESQEAELSLFDLISSRRTAAVISVRRTPFEFDKDSCHSSSSRMFLFLFLWCRHSKSCLKHTERPSILVEYSACSYHMMQTMGWQGLFPSIAFRSLGFASLPVDSLSRDSRSR